MRIGVDLGGTKIEAIALDESGAVLYRHRIATPASNYDGILDAIADLVLAIERQLGQPGSVGAGTPGSLSPQTGLIRNSNSIALNGKPLDRDLSRVLQRPVRIENDANCFALSEAIGGAADGAESVFGVILGTGVGGGLVIHGRVIPGRNRIAGEWGHNPMPWPRSNEWPGPACYCGKTGCIETFLSGPALAKHFRAAAMRDLSAQDIAGAAEAQDAEAQAAIELYEDRLARGLAHVINIFDPGTIVLGGGLSNIARIYEALPRLIPRYIFSDVFETAIVPAVFGDSSGVRGAAMLWPAD
ncbi:MAG: ROK family protein [Candidatus Binataceae bacterium]|jgi:fructokinase